MERDVDALSLIHILRVIPLIIKEETLQAAEQAAGAGPLLELLPYVKKTAAIVATGSEVKKGDVYKRQGFPLSQRPGQLSGRRVGEFPVPGHWPALAGNAG